MRRPPTALTIAGSDSCGGAGIQADLKTFAALQVHGITAITAITAQNTTAVEGVQAVEPDLVKRQIEAVAMDLGVDAAKTGMLFSGEIIQAVAEAVGGLSAPLVVDPVMVSKSGSRLLQPEAVERLTDRLLPLCTVVTPNIPEAEVLSGLRIKDLDDAEKAARKISALGARGVVIKGGHLLWGKKIVNTLYFEGETRTFEGEFVESSTTHGTGCSFSAALAAYLAKGFPVVEAVEKATGFVSLAVKHGFRLGRGHGPVNPMAPLYLEAERYRVTQNLLEAIDLLEAVEGVGQIIPEVQSNIAMALPQAESLDDVLGLRGRIVRVGGRVRAVGRPEFGSSKHVGSTVLAAVRRNPAVRAAFNIKYSEEILAACKTLGLKVAHYDRRKEPPEVKAAEGGSTLWGAEEAINSLGEVPDVIYHGGDWGKEPMVTLLGPTATAVARRALKIAELCGRSG